MPNRYQKAMAAIASELAQEPMWNALAECYAKRAERRDEPADEAAERFARTAELWSFEVRQRLILWLMCRTGRLREDLGQSRYRYRGISGGRGLFEPREVIWSVVLPTLTEWRSRDQNNPEPHFWLGLYEHREHPEPSLREALRLDPDYAPARSALAEHIVKYIEYNQHELPSVYIGEAAEDLISLIEADALLSADFEYSARRQFENKIAGLRAIAEDWIALGDELKNLGWEARSSIWKTRPSRFLQNS